ncbi:hypothetical protein LHEJCM20397_17000 [Lactobacillus helveticus]|nr:hypothetical protein LHEJCM1006_02880 [Lactobacillus helveticus]GFP18152.1 hypothetical protein LHEJCM20397_17000 [Lactobacillus helveticus]GIP66138.1 hypothetical protein LhelvAHU1049_03430 [Lactobacillus helveticus]
MDSSVVVFVEIIVCTGIIFTVLQPILEHRYATAFWTGFGPIFFGLIAYIFYRTSKKKHGLTNLD